MKHVLTLISKRKSSHAPKDPSPTLISIHAQLSSFKSSKRAIFNHFYHSMEKLYKYDSLVSEKIALLREIAFSPEATTRPGVDAIREYFAIRKQLGLNESLLAGLFAVLADLKINEHNPRALQNDLAGPFLLHSPLFNMLLDDVRLLGDPKLEVDLEQLARVFRELTRLGFKSPALSARMLEKVLQLLERPELAPNELSGDFKDQLLAPSLQNYKNVLDYEVFQRYLKDLLKVRNEPVSAPTALKEIRRAEDREIENLDALFERLEAILKGYAALNLDFLNTISEVRDNYFELREEQKMELIRQNPDILMDFVRLENALAQSGFIMPGDLIGEGKLDVKTFAGLLEQFIRELGADPKFIAQLFEANQELQQSSEELAGKEQSVDLIKHSGQLEGGLLCAPLSNSVLPSEGKLEANKGYFFRMVFECFEAIFENARARFSSADPLDNYAHEGFKYAFSDGEDSLKSVFRRHFGEYFVNPFEHFEVIDRERTNIAHFYYTKTFAVCQQFADRLLSYLLEEQSKGQRGLELSEVGLDGWLRLFVLGRKAMNTGLCQLAREKVVALLEKKEAVSFEAIQVIIRSTEFLSVEIFEKLVKLAGPKNIANEIFIAKFLDKKQPLAEQINAAFFIHTVSRLFPENNNLNALNSAIFNFASTENLEKIHEFEYKKEIPLDYQYQKLFYIFEQIKENESDFRKTSQTERLFIFEKARTKISTYLNIDYEFVLKGDPVFALIVNKMIELSPQLAKNFRDTHLLLDLPLPILPSLISKRGKSTNCLLLGLPGEDEDSMAFEMRKRLIAARIENVNIKAMNIAFFFKDAQFFKNMEFTFNENLDANLNELLDESKENPSAEQELISRLFFALRINKLDSQAFKNIKCQFIKILGTIEEIMGNCTKRIDNKTAAVTKALIFFSKAALTSLSGKFPEAQRTSIEAQIKEIELKSVHLLKAQIRFPFAFQGKRFSLEVPSQEAQGTFDFRELINYKAFSNPSYFLLEQWKTDLEDFLGPIQFSEGNEYFFTQNGRFRKAIIPNVKGRLLTRPNFQYFWEDLAYAKSSAEREQAIFYETMTSSANFDRLDRKGRWKLALLNFAYQFRTKANVEQALKELFGLSFWKKLMSELSSQKNDSVNFEGEAKDNKISLSDLFGLADVNYYINPKIAVRQTQSPYEEFVRSKFVLKKSVDELKELIEVTIPRLYSLADSDLAKNNLHSAYLEAKDKYLKALDVYKGELAEVDSAFRNSHFKDRIFQFKSGPTISRKSNEKVQGVAREENMLSSQQKLYEISFNNCLKHFAILSSKERKHEEEELRLFKSLWQQLIKDQGIFQSPCFAPISQNSIASLFSEEDFLYFRENYFHAQIEEFKDFAIADFMVVLGTLLNPEMITRFEAELFVERALLDQGESASDAEKVLLVDFVSCPIANKCRFDLDLRLNKLWQTACQINDSEREVIKKMLSIYKSGFRRRIAR